MAQKKTRQLKTIKKHTFAFWILVALLVGGILGYECANNPDTELFRGIGLRNNFFKTSEVLPKNIELCFTPPSGCSEVIEREISKAISSIYVQAYGMTSPTIADALIKAHERGVKVRVLLDKNNLKDKWSKRSVLVDAGVDVGIDKVPGIAHNKIIVIDEETVMTGSYNFTRAADIRNAENVIIINDKAVANEYLQNWLKRKSKNDFR
jgi:phospholipase D